MKRACCVLCAAVCAVLAGCGPASPQTSPPPAAPSAVSRAPVPTPSPTPSPTPAPERWGIVLKSELAGLEMQVPAEWKVAGREELLSMAGLDASAGEEELAGVPMRYEILAHDTRAGGEVMVAIVNLEVTGSTAATPQQAAESWQSWLEAESPDYTFSPIVEVTLAGHDAALLPTRVGQAIQMDNYLWLQDGAAVCVTMSYPDAQASVVARVLNSIRELE